MTRKVIRKFEPGDRVVQTQAWKDWSSKTKLEMGTIVGYNTLYKNNKHILVRRDGTKTHDSWSVAFWEKMICEPTKKVTTKKSSSVSVKKTASGRPLQVAGPVERTTPKPRTDWGLLHPPGSWYKVAIPEVGVRINERPLSVWRRLRNFVRGILLG